MNSKTYSQLCKEFALRALWSEGTFFFRGNRLKSKTLALIEHDRLMDLHYEAEKAEKAQQG